MLVIADIGYNQQGEPGLEHLSSVSRLTDAKTFAKETLLEVHRKGLAKADEVLHSSKGIYVAS